MGCVRSGILLTFAVLTVIGWLWWRGAFVGMHDVDARVTVIGSQGLEVRGLRIISGADKAFWPVLRSGDTARTRLFTGGDETSLTMQFTINGEQVSWHGPDIPDGAGYRIAIEVDSVGQVTERHCLLPCFWW
jgi:hypothetical protein